MISPKNSASAVSAAYMTVDLERIGVISISPCPQSTKYSPNPGHVSLVCFMMIHKKKHCINWIKIFLNMTNEAEIFWCAAFFSLVVNLYLKVFYNSVFLQWGSFSNVCVEWHVISQCLSGAWAAHLSDSHTSTNQWRAADGPSTYKNTAPGLLLLFSPSVQA